MGVERDKKSKKIDHASKKGKNEKVKDTKRQSRS